MSSYVGEEYSPRSHEGKELLEIVTNDTRNMRTIFRSKFNELTQNTKSLNTFVNKLYQFGVLDLEDKNNILIHGIIESKQMEILYHIVEKSDRNWPKLILAWESTNQHIITILLEFVRNTQT